MAWHLVTAHIKVWADDWEEAENLVDTITDVTNNEIMVLAAKWEEELDDCDNTDYDADDLGLD